MRGAIGPVVLCGVIVVAGGVVYGLQTDRWGPSSQLDHALTRLTHLPVAVGDWHGEDLPHDLEASRSVGVKGYVSRKYTNALTRESVSALVVCGRGGPISVHTPDQCYVRSGFPQLAETTTKQVEVAGRKHAFRVARFGKSGIGGNQMEIYWAWSRDGQSWEAPNDTRMAFARQPFLYKVYVVRNYVAGTRGENAETCVEFMQRALPDFASALVAPE